VASFEFESGLIKILGFIASEQQSLPIMVALAARSYPEDVNPQMSLLAIEKCLRDARSQVAQDDINASLLRAAVELIRETKNVDAQVRGVRREVRRQF